MISRAIPRSYYLVTIVTHRSYFNVVGMECLSITDNCPVAGRQP